MSAFRPTIALGVSLAIGGVIALWFWELLGIAFIVLGAVEVAVAAAMRLRSGRSGQIAANNGRAG